ncbi:short-chain dehydrogenase [Moniliophthora roreri MCA 2997]|uniref:Short-chain dehydrogenase n=2 Tax=Moniliophthora roreri TaxID=221103 RepID=V2Y7J1_MONRO|nr:short-chain dehydrogenase [Moniliophthora roreri MCA 2997]KAI3609600.1 short-chain dehydrogenase [Moniliophthora roreri]
MSTSNLEELKLCNLGDLTGKVALVTGGGTGIGLMIAKGLAANGAKVYISGRREDVLQKVQEEYPSISWLKMDVTNKDDIAHATQVLEEQEGKINILVNNAGHGGPFYLLCDSPGINHVTYSNNMAPTKDRWSHSHFFKQYDFDAWSSTFSLNTTASFFVTMAFLDLLKKGAEASGSMSSVIMVSSAAGSHTKLSWNIPAYASSKAALERLTLGLASDFARNNIPIRVNGISPGPFPSQLTGDSESLNAAMKVAPLPGGINPIPQRRAGTEKEMASIAIYLASPMSSYTNGNNIIVDGGNHLVNP